MSAFIAKLHASGVSYHIVDAGMLQAVVPSRSVTPKELGPSSPRWPMSG